MFFFIYIFKLLFEFLIKRNWLDETDDRKDQKNVEKIGANQKAYGYITVFFEGF